MRACTHNASCAMANLSNFNRLCVSSKWPSSSSDKGNALQRQRHTRMRESICGDVIAAAAAAAAATRLAATAPAMRSQQCGGAFESIRELFRRRRRRRKWLLVGNSLCRSRRAATSTPTTTTTTTTSNALARAIDSIDTKWLARACSRASLARVGRQLASPFGLSMLGLLPTHCARTGAALRQKRFLAIVAVH